MSATVGPSFFRGGLTITNGSLVVTDGSSNKLTVSAVTGNTLIAGTLGVQGTYVTGADRHHRAPYP